MKKWIVLALLLPNLAFAFESPQALQDAFLAGMRANDVEAMAACYTPDATNYTPDAIGTGPDSVHASWGAFFDIYNVLKAELYDGQMEISGDLAAAWGLFSLTVEPKDGGDSFEIQGRYMDVAKEIDGEWLYIADHASVPLPSED